MENRLPNMRFFFPVLVVFPPELSPPLNDVKEEDFWLGLDPPAPSGVFFLANIFAIPLNFLLEGDMSFSCSSIGLLLFRRSTLSALDNSSLDDAALKIPLRFRYSPRLPLPPPLFPLEDLGWG